MRATYLSGAAVHSYRVELVGFRQADFDLDFLGRSRPGQFNLRANGLRCQVRFHLHVDSPHRVGAPPGLPVALLPLKTGTHFMNVEARDGLGHISLTGSIMQVVH